MPDTTPSPPAFPEFPKPDSSTEQINTVAARLRISEERSSEMRKKMTLIEQNMLSNHKRAMSEIKSLQTELSELKRAFQGVEDKLITIVKELRLTSRKEDIDVLRKYVELWDPIRFVTRDTVEKIVDERLSKPEP
ncbi:MAG TPA: hypothetical protein VJJ82_01295 [Candidatus Nanoarchaeia archaeon]|nr:hypothetical protein [Candidatus Nanoarchaeia archaeon]